ncbi:MAG: hydroxyisourate hydrolase [Stappiaceae bacterium]
MAILSSHLLNGTDGTHAGGVAVRLSNITAGTTLLATKMDQGGRLSEQVDVSGAGSDDHYELAFDVAPYWAAQGFAHVRILNEIVLRFQMPDPTARYHMPLIISPNGYSCWVSIPE